MEPKLAAVAGPRQGTVISLDAARTHVGRDATNELCLQSMWVSRRHCVIERRGAGVTITDLGSHNGTFVNGVPVKERALMHGDQVRIGDSIFLILLLENDPVSAGTPVELKEQGMVAGATIELSRSASSRASAASTPPAGRAERDLSVLLRISTAISSIQGVEALERALLESIFEVVPAERGALLLTGRESDEVASTFGLEKDAGPNRGIKVSRTIVLRVLRLRGVAEPPGRRRPLGAGGPALVRRQAARCRVP